MTLAGNSFLARPLVEIPLTFVDLETTGLSARAGDRICEIAAVRYLGSDELDRVVTLINPMRPISSGARRVNGISDTMVRSAPRFVDVFARVRQVLERSVIVAHNAPFDLSFLQEEYGRAGMNAPEFVTVDTCVLARSCFSFSSNSLSSVARAFGIRAGGHRALSDVLVTRAVFERMVAELCEPSVTTLAELLAHQGAFTGSRRADRPGRRTQLSPSAPIDPALATLIQSRQPVRLRYVGTSGVTWRLVSPESVYSTSGTWYLTGYCHLRQENRTFRLDRILAWGVGSDDDSLSTSEP